MFDLRSQKRWASGGWLLLSASCLGGCLAQESYREPTETRGGSAGKPVVASAGKGGLDLVAPPGGAGAGGEPVANDDGCLTSAQCAKPAPYCLAATGHCVECLSRINCAGTGVPYCDLRTYSCVECVNDTQCTSTRPYCAGTLGQCVECLSNENCGDSGLLCDHRSFRCVPSCSVHADCVASAKTPLCDPEINLCVACLADDDCAEPTPRCSPGTRSCVQCVDAHDCQPGVACSAGVCVNPK